MSPNYRRLIERLFYKQQIALVWASAWTPGKFLFFANRYLLALEASIYLVCECPQVESRRSHRSRSIDFLDLGVSERGVSFTSIPI